MKDIDAIARELGSARRVRVLGSREVERGLAKRGYDVSGREHDAVVVVDTVIHGPVSSEQVVSLLDERLRSLIEESKQRLDGLFTRLTRARRRTELAFEDSRDRMATESRKRITSFEAELARIGQSTSYKLGSALVSARTPSGVARLPKRLLDVYRHLGHGEHRRSDRRDTALRQRELSRALDDYLSSVGGSERFVIMFSGTTYLQQIRANRPIRLTRVLLELGVPVYFSYHGSMADEDRPSESHPLLFQAPVDFFEAEAARLLRSSARARTLIVSYPHEVVPRFLNLFNARGWVTLYDCRDDWEEFSNVMPLPWYNRSTEKFVLGNADATLCVSKTLVDKMRAWGGRDVSLSPNAYDPRFLSTGYAHRPTERTVVGYFGHLTDRWFDYGALSEVARRRPEVRFEIVGDGAPEGLALPPNVTMFGPKMHAEICALASRWQAGIIPFRIGKLADAVDPIKIYEYFALGLSVVSFRMPQISSYPYTETVDTVDQFVSALDRAVSTRADPAVLSAFLSKNTWMDRARQMLAASDAVAARPPFEKSLDR